MNAIVFPRQEDGISKWIGKIREAYKVFADLFCDEDQPDWVQAECGTELGGIIAIGLIKKGTHVGANDTERVTNLEDETWWADGIAASPQEMWAIKDTRGSKAAGTPVEEEGFGLQSIIRTGDDKELAFEALNLKDNRDFVAAANRRIGWGLVYVTAGVDSATGGYRAFYAPNTSLYMDDLIEQSIKSRARWAGSVKWSTDMTPSLPFIAPASIFTE